MYFRVENEGHKVYGQNCFPLISLIPGIKFIPLRTNGGEIIPESGLFVRIKKVEGDEDLGSPLPTIPENGVDVTMSLGNAAARYRRRESEGMSPRRVTSPPVLNSYRGHSMGRSESMTPSVTSDDNEVVLTVEIHPEDGMSLPTSPVSSTSPPNNTEPQVDML